MKSSKWTTDTQQEGPANRKRLCPFCKADMEWDDLIRELECPICRVTESELDDMPYEMVRGSW